jgi:anion-transporting  ArsA/GET3 family ATPase
MQPRVQFVVGKGGVGKSTVTAALALAAAARGERVLALELGEAGGLARLFGCPADLGATPRPVRDGLSVAVVEGESALAEYLTMILPLGRLLTAVFESHVYRTFVGAAPGLRELMAMGKIWYEADRKRPDGCPFWDRIIADVGASGHALAYLRMPGVATTTFGAGLVQREAARVRALLVDPATTCVHVVALPEEMPLMEAGEILAALDGELGMSVGTVFVNRCRAAAPAGASELVAALGADGDDARLAVARKVLGAELAWLDVQESELAGFRERSGRDVWRLPRVVAPGFGLAQIEDLVARLPGDGDDRACDDRLGARR